MPINFLEDRHRPQRLGRIRLGVKAFKCQGCGETVPHTGDHLIDCPECGSQSKAIQRKLFPLATPYFVLKDAPAIIAFYGEMNPTALNIQFLWDNLEATFPHYLRRYVKSGLLCLGDGEFIMYRVNDAGIKDVSDGHVLDSNGKPKMDDRAVWTRAVCPGDQCPHYIKGSCKPTGFLRFMPTEAPRLGYYDVVCHQRAIVGIKTQLHLAKELFGHLTDIPFVLHRGEVERIPVKTPQGTKKMPIRTQWIEIEEAWFAENYPRRAEHLARFRRTFRQDVIELFGEDSNGDEPLAHPAGQSDFEEPTFDGEGEEPEALDETMGVVLIDEATGEIVELLSEKLPEPESETKAGESSQTAPGGNGDIVRPADSTTVKGWLTDKAEELSHYRPPTPNQLGLMNGLLSKILGGDRERRSWIAWAWGWESSKDMPGSQVGATLKWLNPIKDTETNEYIPHQHAVSEAKVMLRQAMIDAGQTDMFDEQSPLP